MKLDYMQFVKERDHTTFKYIVSKIVLPGSIIHHDLWKAYKQLDEITSILRCSGELHTSRGIIYRIGEKI